MVPPKKTFLCIHPRYNLLSSKEISLQTQTTRRYWPAISLQASFKNPKAATKNFHMEIPCLWVPAVLPFSSEDSQILIGSKLSFQSHFYMGNKNSLMFFDVYYVSHLEFHSSNADWFLSILLGHKEHQQKETHQLSVCPMHICCQNTSIASV